MPAIKAGEFERMRNGGRITSVLVQPTGTAVSGYQVPLGNRPSLRDVGVVGAPAWTAEQTETWTRTSVSATCPRRLTVFEGGKKNIDKVFEFGDDFDGSTLNTAKWTATGSPPISFSNGAITLASTSGSITANSVFGTGYALIARATQTGTNAYLAFPNQTLIRRNGVTNLQLNTYNASWGNSQSIDSGVSGAAGTQYRYEVIRAPSTIQLHIDRVLRATASGDIMTGSGSPILGGSTTADSIACNWIAVRKYVAAEPVAGTAQPSALNRSMCQSLNLADGLRACCAA